MEDQGNTDNWTYPLFSPRLRRSGSFQRWEFLPLELLANGSYNQAMSVETEELIGICESLPEHKRAEVADFARFLLAREDEERWERLIASDQRRPKLDAFLRQSAAEPPTPMNLDRL